MYFSQSTHACAPTEIFTSVHLVEVEVQNRHRKREATHSRNEVLTHVARAIGWAVTGNAHQTSSRRERKIAHLNIVKYIVVYY